MLETFNQKMEKKQLLLKREKRAKKEKAPRTIRATRPRKKRSRFHQRTSEKLTGLPSLCDVSKITAK